MKLDRRHLLCGAAGAAALSFPQFAFGQGANTDKRLFVVILRGGLDGLAALLPLGDPAYSGARGRIAMERSGQNAPIALNSTFALHPSLPKMKALYDARELLPMHAVATGYRERSHFDGQNVLETGAPAPFARSEGWLNKALGALPRARTEMAMALSAQAPLILRGPTPVSTWSPSALPEVESDTVARLMALYQATDPSLANALQSAMAANDVAMESGAGGMNGGAYARSLTPVAQVAARFLKDAQGPIAAVCDLAGWDTHANQQGVLQRNLTSLDDGLLAFKTEMGPAWRNTVVLIVTEFGRTVAPNGGNGTDHGTGACAFLAGGAVNGGRVLADWPGLSSAALYQNRDLRPTTDLRGVFKAVLAEHMRVPSATLERDAFPDSAGARPVADLLRT